MKKYRNKRFKNNIIDIIACLIFAALVLVSFYYYNEWSKVKALSNIGKTQIDYIIQAPSKEQIDEIRSKQFVEQVVPYVYRNVNVSSTNGNIAANLFVISDISNADYTMFSDALLVKAVDSDTENIAYITEDLSQSGKYSAGDNISVNINGTTISCTVTRIYESDHRYVGGSILLFMSDSIETVLLGEKETMRYSGAFVTCKDSGAGYDYFVSEYMPEGDLRERSEFDSDEAYALYIEQRDQKDASMASFVAKDFLKEVDKRNGAKSNRMMLMMIVSSLVGVVLMAVIFVLRSLEYIRKNVLLDIKDNYSYNQEVSMIGRYYIVNCLYVFLLFAISYVISIILSWVSIGGFLQYIPLVAGIFAVGIAYVNAKRKINKEYYLQKEKYNK